MKISLKDLSETYDTIYVFKCYDISTYHIRSGNAWQGYNLVNCQVAGEIVWQMETEIWPQGY